MLKCDAFGDVATVNITLKFFKHSFILFVNIIKSVRKLYAQVVATA